MIKKPPLFYIKTFGCQMNTYDSGRLGELLMKSGWVQTNKSTEAELIFLNTCSVRDKAVQRVLGHLNHLKPLKDKNPDLIIALGGCVAQQEGAHLFELSPHLDLVVGPQYLPELPGLAAKMAVDRQPVCRIGFDDEKAAWSGPRAPLSGLDLGPLSAFLTVMQGCNNFCTYCVVPYVRGREISREPEEIIKEAQALLNRGAREITLLGQNVNSYGNGLTKPYNFVRLLEEIAGLDNLWRLRFTTSHPKDLSPELIKCFSRLSPLCKQIHLPAQSGSSKVLKEMGRKYSREDYLKLIHELKEASPEIAVMGDMIVGFPGETEADFEDTMSLIEEVQYDNLFSFKYNDRPHAPAANRDDKVPEEEKSRRLSLLQARQKEITINKNEKFLGKHLAVLVEGPFGREPGQLTGRTESQKIVNFIGPENLSRTIVYPKIIRTGANSLLGEL